MSKIHSKLSCMQGFVFKMDKLDLFARKSCFPLPIEDGLDMFLLIVLRQETVWTSSTLSLSHGTAL